MMYSVSRNHAEHRFIFLVEQIYGIKRDIGTAGAAHGDPQGIIAHDFKAQ